MLCGVVVVVLFVVMNLLCCVVVVCVVVGKEEEKILSSSFLRKPSHASCHYFQLLPGLIETPFVDKDVSRCRLSRPKG